MLVVSSGEFRANQKDYLDRVDKGEELIVQRGKTKSYKIVPVQEDDMLMSKEEFYKMIREALAEADAGKVTRLTAKEDVVEYLKSL